MEDNVNTCTCGERPEVELNTDARPLVVLSDEECGCGCDEVELYTDHQPDILLFEEWADEHVDDIVAARQAAEQTLELVTEKSEEIESKVDLILDDTATIKRELGRGVGQIRSDIAYAKSQIRADIADTKSTTVAGVAAIRQDIANIRIDMTLEECTEEEIYEMFNENNTNSNQ
jgi:hypothetical protein